MKALSKIVRASVPELIRIACVLSLIALTIMVLSIVLPGPLPIIFAMSVGHVIGGAAFACYLLAIVLDAAGGKRDAPGS